MKTGITARLSLGLVAIALLAFTLLNNQLFSSIRLDLTQGSLYTLSDGSIEIVRKIHEPVHLYFFFSDTSSRELASLRAYAKQVRELLQEYVAVADGKIILTVVDPAPFSEQEDMAAEFGLQSVPVNNAGEGLYFGLAGTNAVDDQQTIAFFQPDKQAFLEYDISRLLQNLIETDKPVIGLLSSLKIQGDVNMQTFQTTPAWVVMDQLEQHFDIEQLDSSLTQVPENIDLLVLVHPRDLSSATQYALDQFAMGGGRLLIFVDPVAETDRPVNPNPMLQAQAPQASDINKLISAWGITLREGFVLGDAQTAMTVSGGPSAQAVRHMTILGLTSDNFSSTDVTISALESINVSSAGILDINDDVETIITPLIRSSIYAKPIASMRLQILSDPTDLQRDFNPTGEEYVIAARLSGKAVSAFDQNPGADDTLHESATHIPNTGSLNVIVIADTDILSDRLWVRVQNFFGQTIANPWANNGDFIINGVDNLVGSSDLISIRSRGQLTRPFHRVQDIRREAEARYLQSANDLQARLAETETKLTDLQSGQTEQGLLRLSSQQEAALLKFQQEKLRIRKQLRDVRHQLDKDIENLGTTLKFLNIALIPILLTALMLIFNLVRVRRSRADEA